MSTVDNLRAAKAVIDTPEKWTKGQYGRGVDGNSSHIDSAVCFCAMGALRKVVPGFTDDRAEAHYLHVSVPEGDDIYYPHHYNDRADTTHADVMAWYDRAIALAEVGQ